MYPFRKHKNLKLVYPRMQPNENEVEQQTYKGKQVTVIFFFFFFFENICTFNIFTLCTYLTYLQYVHIYIYIQYLLTSGSGGAPVGQPLQVPGGKALSQPRQHPSNRIE